MIEFSSVSKSYGTTTALRDVSFSVAPGEVLAYLGPNGAGKTTTARILTGLTTGYSGRVTVHGSVGYLPQDTGFQEWRTVHHTLTTFARLSGLNAVEAESRVADVIQRLGLAEHAKRRIVHLSGGMQQRLRFAQAIVHRPDIVILDEPLTGLDASSRAEIKRMIGDLARDSRAILLSSHVLSDVEDLATRILILDRGEVKALGTTVELASQSTSQASIVVRGNRLSASATSISAIPSVSSVDATERGLTLHLTKGRDESQAMRRILAVLAEQDVDVQRVERLEPTLEELYLALTEGGR